VSARDNDSRVVKGISCAFGKIVVAVADKVVNSRLIYYVFDRGAFDWFHSAALYQPTNQHFSPCYY
jgi:hypothetical protein